MPGTRKLGRTSDSRNAMMRAMVTYLLENGKIETTVTRAKDVRSMAEKMISLARQATCTPSVRFMPTSPRKMLQRSCLMRSAQVADRNGGYTRIIKIALAAATLLRWQFWSSSDLL